MRTWVAYSLDELPSADWARLAGSRSAFQQEAWYRSAEATGSLRLFLAEESGQPVLALPVYRLDRPGHYYSSPSELLAGRGEEEMLRDRGMSAGVLDRAREAPWYPAMVSMSPYGYRGGVLGARRASPQQLSRFLEFVLDSCAGEGARVVSFHYLVEREDAPLLQVLAGLGGAPAVLGASCYLPLPWTTTEEYFAWLGSSRRSVRAEYRRADQAPGISWTTAEHATPHAGDAVVLAGLFEDTLRRHGETDPPTELLRECASGGAGDSVLFAASDQSGIRSALAAFRQDNVLYPKFFGTNAPRGHYFPLAYWQTLRYALASRLHGIDFGGGATRAKLWRGACLYWDLGMFFFLDRDLRRVAEPLTRVMSTANHSYFTELAERWSRDHAAPPLPQGFDCLPHGDSSPLP